MSVWGFGGLTTGQAASMISPGIRSGDTLGPDLRSAASSTTAIAADTIYGHPIFVPDTIAFSGMALSVGTAVVGVTGKMALYANAGNLTNGALIEESASSLDMNSAGATVLVATFSSGRTLAPGWYWLTSKFNGAAQPYTMSAGGLMGSGAVFLFGSPNLAPFVRSVAGSAVYTRATVADAYANAFPALPILTRGTNTPGTPIMGLVAA